jgi:hypothetical protein
MMTSVLSKPSSFGKADAFSSEAGPDAANAAAGVGTASKASVCCWGLLAQAYKKLMPSVASPIRQVVFIAMISSQNS